MRTLIWKSALLLLINGVLALGVLAIHDRRLDYQPWETDSNVLVTPHDAVLDSILLGSSHAYIFSRFEENHLITQAALGPEILNLALPSGGGIRPARFLLEYALAEKNRARRVIYFLDPFIFFSDGANNAHKFVNYEPLQADFLWIMIRHGYSYRQLLTYVHSKFSYAWFFQQAQPMLAHTHALTPAEVDPVRIQKRIDSLYGDGLQERHFTEFKKDFRAIVGLCKAAGCALHIILPPTLLGPEPGAEQALAFLKAGEERGGYSLHDFSGALPEPRYFYDLDHLNTQGVAYFMTHFCRPVLRPSNAVE